MRLNMHKTFRSSALSQQKKNYSKVAGNPSYGPVHASNCSIKLRVTLECLPAHVELSPCQHELIQHLQRGSSLGIAVEGQQAEACGTP